ncbi:putative enoyl-CoA hydratase/isomerase [Actinomycetospora sp. NBRC 106375]|uniref:enoyl-CoA hydratase/isomerase family protein n=1 Tax=Actinomycetospora sp. NBRC 106375 TaxID=3032207 RepID=UPI0024A44A86|nr:enoyl-CoA hydratase-related protein [Actinomycetospora sp. NBRC 106375]GLZ46354.1 putative enoyl-CoA hydratase/isomerase [Actinomycetospora sp. NBRC 106375]
MTSDAVVVTRDDQAAVAVVRMNRPDRRNALTTELKVALRDALEDVARDESVRAVVLAAAGSAFCVGQDLGEHAETLRSGDPDAMRTVPEHYNRITSALATMPKPAIAAVGGTCVGAGLGFALACDLRLAAAGVRFATAFAGIGFGGDSGLSATLAHAVGASRATDLLMLGDTFTAEQARDWGVVREVVGGEELDDKALALARRLASGPTAAYAEIKTAIALGTVSSLPSVLEHEGAAQSRLAKTQDHRNAVEAFLAKEKPTFIGK